MQMKGRGTHSWRGARWRGGSVIGSSACNTDAMKNARAVSEFEAALLGLSQRTKQPR